MFKKSIEDDVEYDVKKHPLSMLPYTKLLDIDLDEFDNKIGKLMKEIESELKSSHHSVIVQCIDDLSLNEMKYLCVNYIVNMMIENLSDDISKSKKYELGCK